MRHNGKVIRLTILGGIGLALAGAGAAACSHPPPPIVPLAVPLAPPRVIVPEPYVPPESPVVTAPPVTSTPTTPRREAPPPHPSEKPPTPPPTSAAPPPPAPETTTTGPVLQTTPDAGGSEKQILDTISLAKRDLNRVDPKTLGADALAQYNQARRFVDRAQDALTNKNYVYARELADKAAAVARQLPKGGGKSNPTVLPTCP